MIQKTNHFQFPENLSYKFNFTCRAFSVFCLSLLIWLSPLAQPSKSVPSTSPEMDAFLTSNQKLLGTDFVVFAYKDGKIAYKKEVEKELGDFNGKSQVPAGVASQWLVAATVLAYVDEGKISLDDKVSKYIPIFAKYMKTYITIRNCLTFTTGIKADPPGALKLLQKSKYPDLETEVDAFASKREIQTNPGTEIYYSQIGPDIAARVLEVVTKKTFDRCVADKILRPCKMRGTSFTNDNGVTSDAAEGGRVSNGLAARRRVRARGHGLRAIDGCRRKGKLLQIIASGRAVGSNACKQSDSRSVQSYRHFPDRTASAGGPLGLQRQRGFSGGAVVE